MRNYIDSKQKTWDELLHSLVFAINTSHSTSTGHSSFRMIFGREAVLLAEVAIPNPMPNAVTIMDHYMDIVSTQYECHIFANKHLSKAQRYMKKRYDDKIRCHPYK